MSGENNPAWKGGLSKIGQLLRNTPEYAEWRKNVFQRDKYICRLCGKKSSKIIADHILPFSLFPEERLEVHNGQTLCYQCNKDWTLANIYPDRKELQKIWLRHTQVQF